MEDRDREFIREELGRPLSRIADLLDRHFNPPPKKLSVRNIIIYFLGAAILIGFMYWFYKTMESIFALSVHWLDNINWHINL